VLTTILSDRLSKIESAALAKEKNGRIHECCWQRQAKADYAARDKLILRKKTIKMLDQITYGNPTQNQLPYLEAKSPLDKHLPQLIKYGFPLNSSKACREELNEIVDNIEKLKASDGDILKRYKLYDQIIGKIFGICCSSA